MIHYRHLLHLIIIAFLIRTSLSKNSKQADNLANEKQQSCLGVSACKSSRCLECPFPDDCSIGTAISVNCSAPPHCDLIQQQLIRDTKCHFCWQLEKQELECETLRNCSTNDVALHRTVCRVKSHVLCAGRRTFYKKLRCHWTSGYSWRKALFLSTTLGGFGVDRFYLGHWKSAIGKLFSFGGLGLWTLLDIVLIAIGYIQPADESLYI